METDTKEVAIVKQQATKAVGAANDLTIKTADDVAKATDVLSKIKTVAKMLKARKEEITKPLNEALASARELFRKPEADLAEAERIIKGKMLDWQVAEDARIEKAKVKVVEKVESGKMSAEKAVEKLENIGEVQTSVQGKVGFVSTRIVKKYRVVDASKLPREYLMPDMAKITDALKAGLEVPGAESYEEKVIAAR